MYPTKFEITPRMDLGDIIYEIKENEMRLCFCNDGNARYKIKYEVQKERPMTEEEIEKARVIATEKLKKRDSEIAAMRNSMRETSERFKRMETID